MQWRIANESKNDAVCKIFRNLNGARIFRSRGRNYWTIGGAVRTPSRLFLGARYHTGQKAERIVAINRASLLVVQKSARLEVLIGHLRSRFRVPRPIAAIEDVRNIGQL